MQNFQRKNEQIRLSRSFGKAGDKATPGEVAECLVLREDEANPEAPRKLETVKVVLQRYPRTRPEQPGAPANDELRPDLKGIRPTERALSYLRAPVAGPAAPS